MTQQTSLIGSLFMITQLFQIGMGYSPLTAGIRILVWMAMPVLVAPLASVLAGRFGNRPVLLAGLVPQAAGLAWLAAATGGAGFGYGSLVAPLVIAGVGISLCFPVVANAVADAVPFAEIGIASGANKATVELGSVFGVAVTGAVFAHFGGYTSAATFVDGFRPAALTAAGIAALGLLRRSLRPPAGGTDVRQVTARGRPEEGRQGAQRQRPLVETHSMKMLTARQPSCRVSTTAVTL